MEVDAFLGGWINKQIGTLHAAYDQWLKLHKECTASYHTYVELDAEYDSQLPVGSMQAHQLRGALQ